LKLIYKIYLLQIVLSVILFSFVISIYNITKNQYKQNLQNFIQEKISFYKNQLYNSITIASKQLLDDKKLYLEIHKKALEILKKNPNINLFTLKQELKKEFRLKNINIEIYLIDNKYKIYKTTYKPDLGLDLHVFKDSTNYLNQTTKDKKIYMPDFASIDTLNTRYIIYSYSYLKNHKYLELGFFKNNIYSNVIKLFSNYNNFIELKVYVLQKKGNNWQYYILKKRNIKQKQKFFENLKIDKNSKIIKTFKNKQEFIIDNGDIIRVITPLYKQDMFKKLGVTDFILDMNINVKSQKEAMNKIRMIFLISIFIITIFMIYLYIFISNAFNKKMNIIINDMKNKQKITDEKILSQNDELSIVAKTYNQLFDSLNKEIKINQELLRENKRFIADTVHQIRTPLSNIMMNAEMIKKLETKPIINNFIDQIDASVNMLSNSYEDLSYIISYDSIKYHPIEVNLSDVLKQRVKFFTTISKVSFKPIKAYIKDDIYTIINRIELERIIDNNISNAIKYANPNEEIMINLYYEKGKAILEFRSKGNKIENPEKIFDKNYRENVSKRGLGLGLNMVKNICDKYEIMYQVLYENNYNIFRYIFKVNGV